MPDCKMKNIPSFLVAVIFLVIYQKSFVDTLPFTTMDGQSTRDDDVKELEDLKSAKEELHRQIEMGRNERTPTRSNLEIPFPEISNFNATTLSPSSQENFKADKLPFSITSESENKNVKKSEDLAMNSNTLQFTPGDIAEYIFWTGDEKGVTMAVNEFLKEGLMTREEAVDFLQEIQQILKYLQTLYGQLGLSVGKQIPKANPTYDEKKQKKMYDEREEQKIKINHFLSKRLKEILSESKAEQLNFDKEWKSDNYMEDLEKLQLLDLLYTEYTLEEVIHQLAKIIFKQSLTQENGEAKEALQKFSLFLEKQVQKNHLSRSMEKKILDILIESLSEVLKENPNFIDSMLNSSPVQENNLALRNFLKKYQLSQYEQPTSTYTLPYKILQQNFAN